VRAAPAPAIKSVIKCGAGMPSPCNDGKGCDGLDPAAPYDEYQGLIGIPAFQQGTPPFDTDGGNIQYGADGLPTVARTEDVCFSMTVPKGAAPADGWPMMVYAHGTGGSFRSVSVDTGLSKDVALGTLDMGAAPAAAFGYDAPLHGSRRGGSMKKPDDLVFNYLNPRAARDTPLQGAADLFAIARVMEGGMVGDVKVNPMRVALYGHSQGGNAAAITSGFEPVYRAVVLSGTGGGLVLGILNKKQPVAVSGVLPFVLNDIKVSDTHPVMSLMQLYFERADPLNYGRYIVSSPPMDVPPHHVLHIFGSNDNYAPETTQLRFSLHAGLTTIHPVVTGASLDLVTPEMMPLPLKLNHTVGDVMVTAVSAQYNPGPDYDGHFVSTRNADARASLLYMLATFFRDGTPIVK